MDLLCRYILLFELGLNVGHEAGWAAQEIVGIDVVDQIGQQGAVDAALAVIAGAGFIILSGYGEFCPVNVAKLARFPLPLTG
jgi:hypothetical protein